MAARAALCYAVALSALTCPSFLTRDIAVDATDLDGTSAAQSLIDGTKSSNVFHLDLLVQHSDAESTPWFDGFDGREGEQGAATAGAVAVATIVHPIRRMLVHLRNEGVGLDEAMSWAERGGKSADSSSSYRQGYQVVDNFLVRALGGKSAWDLPPGDIGKAELQAARIALGKFEVLLRAGCLAADLPLLQPYLATPAPEAELQAAARETENFLESGDALFLDLGSEGGKLLRGNRWDLQLWDFARELVESRSTSAESYLCDSSTAARNQRMPGDGRRAVVYNSPSFHITGVAMFSCVLMSLGFDVTAVIKEPGAGFQHLLPCPNRVVTLDDHYLTDTPGEILDEETAAALSLPMALTAEQEEQRERQQEFYEENQRLKKQEEEEEELRRQQEQQRLEEQEEEDHQEEEQYQDGDQEQGEVDGEGARRRRKRERRRRRATVESEGSSLLSSSPWASIAGLPATRDGLDGFGGEEEDAGDEEVNTEEGGWKAVGGGGGGLSLGDRGNSKSSRSSSNIRGRKMRAGGKRELLVMAAGTEQERDHESEGFGGSGGGGGPGAGRFFATKPERKDGQRAEQEGAMASLQREEGAAMAAPAEEDKREDESSGNGRQRRRKAESESEDGEADGQRADAGDHGDGDSKKERGPFDLSVLCTAVNDVNHLMKATYPVDPRIADALLWGVDVSIWNIHSVEAAFRSDHRVPPTVDNFARGVPSMEERGGGGRMPPQTFLTLYGEHVEKWERWSEEAYEGWGWAGSEGAPGDAPGRGRSTLGGLFRRPGVVYPIHPTGHLKLPRPKGSFAPPLSPRRELVEMLEEGPEGVQEEWENGKKDSDEGRENEGEGEGEGEGGEVAISGRKEDVVFVVQGNMQSYRRDYPMLVRCLEAMCSAGRANYKLVAVGARGDLPEEMGTKACVEERTTEWRHLEYPEFYANISAGHFVVTAAAGHDYEYDKATSTVPTALLLERPLVMSSTLLDAYPCLRKSRVHSMVANDDLCLNLQAAYDLTTSEYDEMELEARDCKLEMWRHARETVAAMASGWTLD